MRRSSRKISFFRRHFPESVFESSSSNSQGETGTQRPLHDKFAVIFWKYSTYTLISDWCFAVYVTVKILNSQTQKPTCHSTIARRLYQLSYYLTMIFCRFHFYILFCLSSMDFHCKASLIENILTFFKTIVLQTRISISSLLIGYNFSCANYCRPPVTKSKLNNYKYNISMEQRPSPFFMSPFSLISSVMCDWWWCCFFLWFRYLADAIHFHYELTDESSLLYL